MISKIVTTALVTLVFAGLMWNLMGWYVIALIVVCYILAFMPEIAQFVLRQFRS